MQIEQKQVPPDIDVLEISGRIVLGRESQRIEWLVEELLGKNRKKIIFDITHVEYVDSAGLGIIVGCSGKIKTGGGELRVVGANQRVQQIFKMTGLTNVLAIYPDVAGAKANFTVA